MHSICFSINLKAQNTVGWLKWSIGIHGRVHNTTIKWNWFINVWKQYHDTDQKESTNNSNTPHTTEKHYHHQHTNWERKTNRDTKTAHYAHCERMEETFSVHVWESCCSWEASMSRSDARRDSSSLKCSFSVLLLTTTVYQFRNKIAECARLASAVVDYLFTNGWFYETDDSSSSLSIYHEDTHWMRLSPTVAVYQFTSKMADGIRLALAAAVYQFRNEMVDCTKLAQAVAIYQWDCWLHKTGININSSPILQWDGWLHKTAIYRNSL